MNKYDYIMERADRELYSYGLNALNHEYYCVMALCMLLEDNDPRIVSDMLWRHIDGALIAVYFISKVLDEYGGVKNGEK